MVALAFAARPVPADAADEGLAPWPAPSQPLELPTYALAGISDAASAEDAIAGAVAALGDNQCEDSINLVALFIEEAIRRGTTFGSPANGVFYTDMLQISADIAQSILGHAQGVLADAGVDIARPLAAGINFVSDERGALDISFPYDVSGIGFNNITVEAEFAAITLRRESLSGNNLRIERGLPIATGGYAYSLIPGVTNGPVPSGLVPALGFLLDFWAIGAFVVIMVVWGVLTSKGKRLRLWVVPVAAVILIIANILTLGPHRDGPDGAVYALVPVYFYSVVVDMPPGVGAVLSVPADGVNPYWVVLVNENFVPQPSRYNPFTGAIEAYISVGGKYFLRDVSFTL